MKNRLPATVIRRRAVIYVRQSTPTQVEKNLESQRRQYDLVELARTYGFHDIEVIDEDLGRSAGGSTDRPGFQRLLGWLCAGSVGAVFCLEASRLARNGHDWHRLLELCGLVGARVADTDGIYDPCLPNDRLLLGMKGTISEFELGMLRARLNEAMWAKARRGELRIAVPIGFVWERNAPVAFDPDLRLQEVIRLIFRKFKELGSARQVHLWMRQEQVHFPRPSDGKRMTSFEWQLARYRNVISVLKNPFYAGMYAYGKSEHRTKVVDGRPRKSYGHPKSMEEWDVTIKQHHEGYITWAEYERNQEQIGRNTFCRKGGASKSGRGGRALLAGLLRCRRCGHRLHVAYRGRAPGAPIYRCAQRHVTHGTGRCICFGVYTVDRAVARELLRAVQPLSLEAAVQAERTLVLEREERRRIHELELEQARYDAKLAERRYAACDPDNRLIAAQLESSWEESLQRVAACEKTLCTVDAEPAPAPAAHDLDCLAADLEAVWDAPSVTMRTRQSLVRSLINEIVVDIDDEASEVILVIHWKGGQHSETRARKPRTGETRLWNSEEAVELVRSMAGRWPDDQIAATMNRLGLRTGKGNTWNATRVQSLRKKRRIPAYKSANKDGTWLTMSEAARKLGLSNHAIRQMIKSGVLPAEQVVPRAPYQIRTTDLDTEAVRRVLASRGRPC